MNPYLDVAPEVAQALAQGKPVVALESTIISHGMPYPQNVETAQAVDIDEEFGLVVRGADGKERTVRSGEVSVRGLWGYTE